MADSTNSVVDKHETRFIAPELMMEWFLFNLGYLFDSVGEARCLECMEPYLKMEASDGIRRLQVPPEVKEDTKMYIAYVWNQSAFITGFKYKVEIAENGAIITINECPTSKLPMEFCLVHDLLGKCIIKAIEPSYTHRYVKMLSIGDDCCKVIARPQSVELDQWENYGEIIATLLPPNIPEQVIADFGTQYACHLWLASVDGITRAVGSKQAIKAIRPLMRKSGIAFGYGSQRALGLDLNDPSSLEKLLSFTNKVMMQKDYRLDIPDTQNQFMISCQFQNESEIVCNLINAFIEGALQSLETNVKLVCSKESCSENKYCEMIIKTV